MPAPSTTTSSRRTVVAEQREPAWLVAKVDQRLALMQQATGGPGLFELDDKTVVLLTLTEPGPGATPADFERWDKTCDNCGHYCPSSLYTGHVTREWGKIQAIITFGVCPSCKEVSDRESRDSTPG